MLFSEINNQLLCGELQRVNVEFRNVGRVGLKNLYVGLSHPQYISVSTDNKSKPFASLLESKYLKPPVVQGILSFFLIFLNYIIL